MNRLMGGCFSVDFTPSVLMVMGVMMHFQGVLISGDDFDGYPLLSGHFLIPF